MLQVATRLRCCPRAHCEQRRWERRLWKTGSSRYGTAREQAGRRWMCAAREAERSLSWAGGAIAKQRLAHLAAVAADGAVLAHFWEASSVLETHFWPRQPRWLGRDRDIRRRSASLGAGRGGEQAETPHPATFSCWAFSNRINGRQKSIVKAEKTLSHPKQEGWMLPWTPGMLCGGCHLLGNLPGWDAAWCSTEGGSTWPGGAMGCECLCQESWGSMQHTTAKRTSMGSLLALPLCLMV